MDLTTPITVSERQVALKVSGVPPPPLATTEGDEVYITADAAITGECPLSFSFAVRCGASVHVFKWSSDCAEDDNVPMCHNPACPRGGGDAAIGSPATSAGPQQRSKKGANGGAKDMKECSGCKLAVYCTAACQKAHARRHSPVCKGTRAVGECVPLTGAPARPAECIAVHRGESYEAVALGGEYIALASEKDTRDGQPYCLEVRRACEPQSEPIVQVGLPGSPASVAITRDQAHVVAVREAFEEELDALQFEPHGGAVLEMMPIPRGGAEEEEEEEQSKKDKDVRTFYLNGGLRCMPNEHQIAECSGGEWMACEIMVDEAEFSVEHGIKPIKNGIATQTTPTDLDSIPRIMMIHPSHDAYSMRNPSPPERDLTLTRGDRDIDRWFRKYGGHPQAVVACTENRASLLFNVSCDSDTFSCLEIDDATCDQPMGARLLVTGATSRRWISHCWVGKNALLVLGRGGHVTLLRLRSLSAS
eukprot:TRINITY_DN3015_c0_g1_i2.p2 TRINITY_DN3015_c0_g1~~TRINITY_DN3015_c0_g1_i2.p2  ORF type:complete len:476 (-),score=96.57 TRINITY_DN3015_c0_g1_i2:2598-4025(-)